MKKLLIMCGAGHATSTVVRTKVNRWLKEEGLENQVEIKQSAVGQELESIKNGEYDIQIENNRYIWNLTNESWVTRQDSHCTIGCIHTTQGYDLNYVGVIFGKEIDYDFKNNSIIINLDEYKDSKVKAGTNEKILKQLIINTYTTILSRGIKGCYVYAYNKNMQKYLKQFILPANKITLEEK